MRRTLLFTHILDTPDKQTRQREERQLEAVDQIDKLIESRRRGREQANALAQLEKAEDARLLREMRQEHRVLWCEHFRRLAACNLKAAREFRRRARELEATEGRKA